MGDVDDIDNNEHIQLINEDILSCEEQISKAYNRYYNGQEQKTVKIYGIN